MNFYSSLTNIAIYQCVWFASVLGGQMFAPAVVLLIVLHVILCGDRRHELTVMLVCAALGLSVDALLTLAGVLVFEQSASMLLIPLWLANIWLGFAATLRHGLDYFIRRPPLAIFAAALGAPLSYLAASRLGAVTLPLGWVMTAMILAPVWVGLMSIFIVVTRAVPRTEASSMRRPTADA